MKWIGFIELSLQLSGSSCCAHYQVCRRVEKQAQERTASTLNYGCDGCSIDKSNKQDRGRN